MAERLNTDGACDEDTTLTTAAIDAIDARIFALGERLVAEGETILYHSQYAPGDLPGTIAEESADRLEAAYGQEEALGREIDELEEIQRLVADGTADGDLVMHYAQEAADLPVVPQQTVEDL